MERLLTAEELSKLINFKIETIYKWVQRKLIPHHRFGKRCVRFKMNEIEKWLQKKHVEARR